MTRSMTNEQDEQQPMPMGLKQGRLRNDTALRRVSSESGFHPISCRLAHNSKTTADLSQLCTKAELLGETLIVNTPTLICRGELLHGRKQQPTRKENMTPHRR